MCVYAFILPTRRHISKKCPYIHCIFLRDCACISKGGGGGESGDGSLFKEQVLSHIKYKVGMYRSPQVPNTATIGFSCVYIPPLLTKTSVTSCGSAVTFSNN